MGLNALLMLEVSGEVFMLAGTIYASRGQALRGEDRTPLRMMPASRHV